MRCSSCKSEVPENCKYCTTCGVIPVKRGDVFWADLTGIKDGVGGQVPVFIIQNNIGNKYSPTVIILCGANDSKKGKDIVAVKMYVGGKVQRISFDCSYLTTLDKRGRLLSPIGRVHPYGVHCLEQRLRNVFYDNIAG